jgi:hypothetical protein
MKELPKTSNWRSYIQLPPMTRPQLLGGLKDESQVENSGKGRSRDMLPNSQH